MLSVGVLLLLATAVGHWTSFGNYHNRPQPRQWEQFDASLAAKITSFSKLREETQRHLSSSSSEREIMDVLYKTVTEWSTHNDARHTFLSNWICYIFGMVHPAFAHIYDPDKLVANGHSLLCDQSSYILLKLALENGIRARHVGLDGHVIMEAWFDSDWHLYDPDMEVVPINAAGEVLSVEELALNTQLLEKYYGPFGHNLVQIVASRENNTYMSYPVGSRFVWKSEVLVYFEKIMEALKFAIPIGLILCGLVSIKFRSIGRLRRTG